MNLPGKFIFYFCPIDSSLSLQCKSSFAISLKFNYSILPKHYAHFILTGHNFKRKQSGQLKLIFDTSTDFEVSKARF